MTFFAETQDAKLAEAETFSKPGTADVTPADRKKLRGLIAHYAKMAHPFTTCVRDQRSHGLSPDHANRRCAVIKQLGLRESLLEEVEADDLADLMEAAGTLLPGRSQMSAYAPIRQNARRIEQRDARADRRQSRKAKADEKKPGDPDFDESKVKRDPGGQGGGRFIRGGGGADDPLAQGAAAALGMRTTSTFKEITRRAIVRFQRENDIAVDGVIGTQTVAAMRGVTKGVAPGALTRDDRQYLRKSGKRAASKVRENDTAGILIASPAMEVPMLSENEEYGGELQEDLRVSGYTYRRKGKTIRVDGYWREGSPVEQLDSLLGQVKPGERVVLPDGIRVARGRSGEGFEVAGRTEQLPQGMERGTLDRPSAARRAMRYSAKSTDSRSLGGSKSFDNPGTAAAAGRRANPQAGLAKTPTPRGEKVTAKNLKPGDRINVPPTFKEGGGEKTLARIEPHPGHPKTVRVLRFTDGTQRDGGAATKWERVGKAESDGNVGSTTSGQPLPGPTKARTRKLGGSAGGNDKPKSRAGTSADPDTGKAKSKLRQYTRAEQADNMAPANHPSHDEQRKFYETLIDPKGRALKLDGLRAALAHAHRTQAPEEKQIETLVRRVSSGQTRAGKLDRKTASPPASKTGKTPGYNTRLSIFIETDKNGRERAYKFTTRTGAMGRAFPMPLDEAKRHLANGDATRLSGHPTKQLRQRDRGEQAAKRTPQPEPVGAPRDTSSAKAGSTPEAAKRFSTFVVIDPDKPRPTRNDAVGGTHSSYEAAERLAKRYRDAGAKVEVAGLTSTGVQRFGDASGAPTASDFNPADYDTRQGRSITRIPEGALYARNRSVYRKDSSTYGGVGVHGPDKGKRVRTSGTVVPLVPKAGTASAGPTPANTEPFHPEVDLKPGDRLVRLGDGPTADLDGLEYVGKTASGRLQFKSTGAAGAPTGSGQRRSSATESYSATSRVLRGRRIFRKSAGAQAAAEQERRNRENARKTGVKRAR